MTAPTRGDRVRCSQGESVVFGRFDEFVEGDRFSASYAKVFIEDDLAPWAFVLDQWTLAVVPWPEPPLGTVVLDGTGLVWQSHDNGHGSTRNRWFAARARPGNTYGIPTFAMLEERYGPLTLLEVAR